MHWRSQSAYIGIPVGQSRQNVSAVAPDVVEYLPPPHDVQPASPATLVAAHVPAGHARQSESPPAPALAV